MKNLFKKDFWNPFFAISNKGDCFELNNIIIYNENGKLLETNCGWFEISKNNILQDLEIKPEIKRKLKVDFTKKENFVVKSDCVFGNRYCLYIYYKNINYKYTGLSLDTLYLNLHFSILNQFEFSKVIGNRHNKTYDLKYSIEEHAKQLNTYNLEYHIETFENELKEISKIKKQYIKELEIENSLTVADYKKLVRSTDVEMLENNEKTFNK